jgi:hypothetical protein
MKHLLLPLLICIFACNNSPEKKDRRDGYTPVLNNQEDSLYHEVMKGHDVGMAKMGELRGQHERVKHFLDSINKLSAKQTNRQHKQALLDLQEELSYADYAMFEWMKAFNADSARNDSTARIAYLKSERVKVLKVRDNILNGLKKADSLLRK